MAVARAEETAKLIIRVQTGVNDSGKAVYASRSLANLNPELTDEAVWEVGEALGNLQEFADYTVTRQENASLRAAE